MDSSGTFICKYALTATQAFNTALQFNQGADTRRSCDAVCRDSVVYNTTCGIKPEAQLFDCMWDLKRSMYLDGDAIDGKRTLRLCHLHGHGSNLERSDGCWSSVIPRLGNSKGRSLCHLALLALPRPALHVRPAHNLGMWCGSTPRFPTNRC